jgi:hypothetical protein
MAPSGDHASCHHEHDRSGNHPKIFCRNGSLSVPVTLELVVISIITTMIGTAATPLITALRRVPGSDRSK